MFLSQSLRLTLRFFLFTVMTLVFVVQVRAEVVGSFSDIQDSPAWLTFDEKSELFQGLVDKTKSVEEDGIERRTPSRILKSYFDSKGLLRKALVEKQIERINDRMRADFSYDCREEKDCDEKSEKEFQKWTQKGAGLAARVAIARLQKFVASGLTLLPNATDQKLNSSEVRLAAQSLFEGLEIAEAIRSDDRWLGRGPFRPFIELKDPIRIQIPFAGKKTLEATNLSGVSGTLVGLNPTAAASLDPVESGFWRRPKSVSQFETSAYNGLTKSFVGPEIINPDKSVDVTFLTAKGGGATPKIRVDYKSGKTKLKFKLKYRVEVAATKNQNSIGALYASLLKSRSEVRVETAVNNIAAAMGYTVEPTYYKRSVRLFLPDDGFDIKATDTKNLEGFKAAQKTLSKALYDRALAQTFGAEVVIRDSAFQDVQKVTEGEFTGRYFLKMENVQLEPREDGKTEIDVGFFVKHAYGREFKREFRAFQLFYAWVADTDTGDRNADFKLLKDGDDWKIAYSASDMGASLGFLGSKDSPNLFLKSMVRKVEPNAITLNYLTEARNPLMDALTLADAHWFLKYATELTPSQLQKAFLGAGYNTCVADVLANKMMSRRQSLVMAAQFPFAEPKYFDLKSCSKLGIEIGKNWEIVKIPDPVAKNAKTPAEDRPLYPEDNIGWTRGRPAELVKGMASWGGAMATQGVGQALQRTHVVPGLFVDGGSVQSAAGVGFVSILPARYIIANPLPNRTSPWLIVDIYRVGVGPRYWLRQNLRALHNERNVVNGEAYLVRERVMVRQVDHAYKHLSFEDLMGIYSRPDRFIKLAWDKIDSEDIETLNTGELLISSTYKGVSVGTSLSPAGFFSIGGGLVSIAGGADLIQRQAVFKETDSQLLTAWILGDRKYVRAGAGVSVFLRILGDIASFGARKEVEKTKLFRFNTTTDIAMLKEEIRNTSPTSAIPKDREIHESKVDTNSRSLLLSAFGFQSVRSSKHKILTEVAVGNQTLKQLDIERSRRRGGMFNGSFKNSEVSTRGTLSSEQNLIVRMDVTYRNIWARKKDLADFKKLVEIFPENGLIRYDSQWNDWLGSVAVDGVILFSQKAIEKILAPRTHIELCDLVVQQLQKHAGTVMVTSLAGAWTNAQFCEFAMDHRNSNTLEAARKIVSARLQDRQDGDIELLSSVLVSARQFLWSMQQAQTRLTKFMKTNSLGGKATTESASEVLEKLTQVLHENALPQVVMRLVDQLIDKDDHYRFVSVRSSTEGIPGQNAVVSDAQGDEEYLRTMMQQDLATTAESAIHQILGAIPMFDGIRNMRLDRAYIRGGGVDKK